MDTHRDMFITLGSVITDKINLIVTIRQYIAFTK